VGVAELGLLFMSFLVGTLVGLTSMGGAALMTPFLILVLGVRPVLAVGTDLAYGAITNIAGAAMHWRQGTVDTRAVRYLAFGSVPGATLGFLLIRELRQHGYDVDLYLRRALGCVLVTVALLMFVRTVYGKFPEPRAEFLKRNQRPVMIAWGAMVGFAVGLTSVGSGSLVAPFLLVLYPGMPALVVGTDVFHASVLISTAAALHIEAGNVAWRLLPYLLMGAVPGVLVGSYLAPRLPARTMRLGLSLVLLTTGVKLV
jgi:uncharacterized membrane protein YfcA